MWETMSLFALIYIFIIYLSTRYAYAYFSRKKWFAENYMGLRIVQSFGLLIGLHYAYFALLLIGYTPVFEPNDTLAVKQKFLAEAPIFLVSMFIITFMGWADDVFGTTEVKGIKGHMRAFFVEHKLTTGFLKAIIGCLVAWGSMYVFSETLLQWLLNTSLVVLSIHVFNLLDVRPGRAIKSYWFFTLLLLPFYTYDGVLGLYFLPALISTLLIFPYERKLVRPRFINDLDD